MQLSETTKKFITVAIAVLIILLLLSLVDLFLFYQFSYFGHFVLIFLIIILLKNIIRLFVFPGSFWFWRRNVENRYAKGLAKRYHKRIQDAASIIEKIVHQKQCIVSQEDLITIRQTIIQFLNTFQAMQDKNKLNPSQRHLLGLMQQLENQLKNITLPCGTSLYDSFENPPILCEYLNERELNCSGQEFGVLAAETISQIEQLLVNIYGDLPLWKSVERWCFNKLLGTAEQMRQELENNFKTRRYQIRSYDGKLIDCLYIMTPEDDSESTVVFCQPNAGYYEYMYYESEWIEYYVKRRVNLFLWNYRGYGESEGFPHTLDILLDGESVVDFVHTELKPQKLVFHGESLGGMVACHLGKTKQGTLLFADRTFSSISEIATIGFTKYARVLFNLLTSWNYDSATSFAECPYYKILAMDVGDEVIPYLSSLKVSVGKLVFVKEFSQRDDIFSQHQPHQFYLIEKWRNKFRYMVGESNVNEFKEIWNVNIMSQADMVAFFDALRRLENLMVELAMERRKLTAESVNTSQIMDKSLNDSVEITTSGHFGDSSIDEEASKLSTYPIFNVDRQSESLKRFIAKVYENFHTLEAASLTLHDVFLKFPEKQQFQVFQDFLLSFFVWGSYQPLRNIARKKMNTLICQKLALARLSGFLQKIDNLIKQERSAQESTIPHHVLNDVDLVAQKLKTIRENFKKAARSKQQSQATISIEMVEQKPTQPDSAPRLMDGVNKNLGCFIPLQCGHNGILSSQEVDTLDFHMSQAGVIQI